MDKFENKAVSIWEWLLSYFIIFIPVIGFIMLFVWAFGNKTKLSKKNWAIAMLILEAIIIVLYAVFVIYIISSAGSISNFLEELNNY